MDNSALRMGTGFNDGTLALIGVAILLAAFAAWSSRGPNVEKTDFALTYVGAYIVHEGSGTDLYDTRIQVKLRDSMFQNPSPLYFEHPPFEALALAPLAALPFRTAYLVWGFVNVAVLLGVVVWLRPKLHWPSEDIAYLFLWLIFAPVLVAIYQGQSSIIVLAAYGAAFIFLKKNKPVVAGLLFGLALLKFQFAVPFAIVFFLRRHWRFVAGFSGAAIFLGLYSLLGIGWDGSANYVRLLSQIGNNPRNISYGSAVDMPTLHGLVFALAGHALNATRLNIAVAILSIALLTWVAWKWTKSNWEASFAAGIAASLLCGSHMFTHDFSPLGTAMFLLAGSLRFARKSLRFASWFILAVFWTFPFYFLFVKWHCLYIMAIVLLAFTWCCLRVAGQTTVAKSSELQTVATG
jgi:Glycosyltransferase family 87